MMATVALNPYLAGYFAPVSDQRTISILRSRAGHCPPSGLKADVTV